MWHLTGIFVPGTQFAAVWLLYIVFYIFNGCMQAYGIYMYTTVEVQWDTYVQCGRHICSGAYLSNMELMYSSGHGHIVYCIEII